MLENLILKKNKISGVSQSGSISADANFGFNNLRHFFNNFANSCAHFMQISGIFQNTPNIYHFMDGTYG